MHSNRELQKRSCLGVFSSPVYLHFLIQTVPSDTAASQSLSASSLLKNDSPLAHRMSLHHGLTDLRNNHFTDSYILP